MGETEIKFTALEVGYLTGLMCRHLNEYKDDVCFIKLLNKLKEAALIFYQDK